MRCRYYVIYNSAESRKVVGSMNVQPIPNFDEMMHKRADLYHWS